MMHYAFFLGSNPKLSELELMAVLNGGGFDPHNVSPSPRLLLAELDKELPDDFIERMGGCERVARVIAQNGKPWNATEIVDALSPIPLKFTLGLSELDCEIGLQDLAKEIKNECKKRESKVRFILPKKSIGQLNSAQVMFNKLDESPNMEVTTAKIDETYWLLKTIQVQDVQSYEIRDTSRPARFGKVGMLPPKLAQIMINLAVADIEEPYILDPFCGMGTVLQEGWLMGYKMLGSDINSDMVKASRVNLNWLDQNFRLGDDPKPKVIEQDATKPFAPEYRGSFDAIVTEPYLGEALHSPLPLDEIEIRQRSLEMLYLNSMKRLRRLLRTDGRVLLILPTFWTGTEYWYLPTTFLDEIEKLGYRMKHLVPDERILYAREGAFVGREITLWHTRKPGAQRKI